MTDPSRGHPRLRSGRQIINNPSRIVTPGGGTHLAPRTGRIINAAHLTFGTLNLTGDTILDFSNRSACFLTAASLNISGLKLCRQISRIKPRWNPRTALL